ncbi:MAG TPA: polysaccharide deacetylase family protein [Candidatus Saccharimonadales bacterium]|nr:polysaccharide deacetylase family protein [Candidatus Saccharimonadales bacterium]
MGNVRHRFAWMTRPQLFVGFLVICLCVGALGSVFRAVYASPITTGLSPQVRGAQVELELNCHRLPCLALTFDDGPESGVTPRILDILANEHVTATFFVVGKRVPGNEGILRRMHAEGHEIGNHSWSHPNLTKMLPAEVDAELAATQRAVIAAGVPAPRILRPPYGAVNDIVKSHAKMSIVRWDIDPEDWKVRDPALINAGIMAQAKPGGIILLHDIYSETADALTPAIEQLKSRYQFVTVSQLMNLSAGDQGQYFGYK